MSPFTQRTILTGLSAALSVVAYAIPGPIGFAAWGAAALLLGGAHIPRPGDTRPPRSSKHRLVR